MKTPGSTITVSSAVPVAPASFIKINIIILNIRTPGDGIENKSFFEEVLFVSELSCGTSHIVRHSYDVVGSMLSICCLPLSANWRASWRVIGRSIVL